MSNKEFKRDENEELNGKDPEASTAEQGSKIPIIWEMFFDTMPDTTAFIIEMESMKGYYDACVKSEDSRYRIPEILNALKQRKLFSEINEEDIPNILEQITKFGRMYLKQREENPLKSEQVNKIAALIQQKVYENLGTSKRPTRSKIKRALQAGLEELRSLTGVLEKETDDPDVLDIVKQNELAFQNKLMEILADSHEKGELDYRALYYDPASWISVVNSENYLSMRAGLGILDKNMPEIIEITSGGKGSVKAIDIGTGGGEKGEEIKDNYIQEGKNLRYVGVDSVPSMLNVGTIRIAMNQVEKILDDAKKLKKAMDFDDEKKVKEMEQLPWFPLMRLINSNELSFSENPALHRVLDRIFYKFVDTERSESTGGADARFFKHLIARMLSLHKGRKSHMPIIERLDRTPLPLQITPCLTSVEEMGPEEFRPEKNTAVVTFDLGCRVCNQPPSKSIPKCKKYLNEPTAPEDIDGPVPPERESEVDATYAVIGFQPSHFDNSHPRFEEEAESMKRGYESDEFIEFLTNPLRLNASEYSIDGQKHSFNDLRRTPVIDFPEGKNKLEELLEHLTTNGVQAEVNSAIDKLDDRFPEGFRRDVQNFKDRFEKFLEELNEMDSPEEKKYLVDEFLSRVVEDFLQRINLDSKHDDIMPQLNQFMKDWKEPVIKIETEYEKYTENAEDMELYRIAHYLRYNHPVEINIGSRNFKKEAGDKMLLHFSFKPTIEQMEELFNRNGMRIVKKYCDNPDCPKYTKFLIRNMTPAEEEEYKKSS
jgi:hypothetical protein